MNTLTQLLELSIVDKISYISIRKPLTITQWDNDTKHYRVGINWDDNDVEFLVERPTLEQGLNDMIIFMNTDFKEWKCITNIYSEKSMFGYYIY